MSPLRAMSLTESIDSRFDRVVSVLWGCQLSSTGSSYTFEMPEDWHNEHQLVVNVVGIEERARDEFHLVEVVTVDDRGASRAPVPLAVLKPSVLPMVALAGVALNLPVTFRLRTGSGPVYVTGQHLSVVELSSEEEEEEDEEEETPEKPRKGSNTRKGGAAKKRKMEKGDELNNLTPEDPAPAKGRGAGRGRKAAPKK